MVRGFTRESWSQCPHWVAHQLCARLAPRTRGRRRGGNRRDRCGWNGWSARSTLGCPAEKVPHWELPRYEARVCPPTCQAVGRYVLLEPGSADEVVRTPGCLRHSSIWPVLGNCSRKIGSSRCVSAVDSLRCICAESPCELCTAVPAMVTRPFVRQLGVEGREGMGWSRHALTRLVERGVRGQKLEKLPRRWTISPPQLQNRAGT